MIATKHPESIRVCTDCLMILANGTLGAGDVDEDWAHADKMEAQWSNTEITLGWTTEQYAAEGIDPEDEEADQLGFTWSTCEGCGSTLGGDRYAATAWISEDHED